MSDRYVLDATVAVRWFLPGQDDDGSAAKVLALFLAGDIVFLAPENLVHEFCGIICKHFRLRNRSPDDALGTLDKFFALPIEYVGSRELIKDAVGLAFRHNKTFYDMYYFSVGRNRDIPVCTADERCVSGVDKTFPAFIRPSDLLTE